MNELRIKLTQHNQLKIILKNLRNDFGFFIIEIDEEDLLHIHHDKFELHQYLDYLTIKYF